MRVHHERKSDGVKVHHQKEWCKSLPKERAMAREFTIRKRAMGWEFTMRKSDGVKVHHKKERWGKSLP